jgi:hypothetical protein
MVRKRKSDQLDAWLEQASASPLQELHRFALGLHAEHGAMRAALSEPWSTGQVEGQITRLKYLKRQMYGRAHIDRLASACVTCGLRISLKRTPKSAISQRRCLDTVLRPFSVLKRKSRWHNRSFGVCGNGSKGALGSPLPLHHQKFGRALMTENNTRCVDSRVLSSDTSCQPSFMSSHVASLVATILPTIAPNRNKPVKPPTKSPQ